MKGDESKYPWGQGGRSDRARREGVQRRVRGSQHGSIPGSIRESIRGWMGAVFLLLCFALQEHSLAQGMASESLLGTWVTYDDDTQEPRAHIKITQDAGVLSGRIVKTLDPDAPADERCVQCRDDRKNQPILGLEIIRGGAKKNDKELIWEGGKILDPENGEEYRFRIKMIDQGRTLQVRGYLGPFWRTQVWRRL